MSDADTESAPVRIPVYSTPPGPLDDGPTLGFEPTASLAGHLVAPAGTRHGHTRNARRPAIWLDGHTIGISLPTAISLGRKPGNSANLAWEPAE